MYKTEKMERSTLPIAIVGGGPVGLAAAAHLVRNKQPFLLFESGDTVGANVLNWGHVKVFSPWRYNIDKAAEELLLQAGWVSPDKDSLHTGREFYDLYFRPLAALPSIKPYIKTHSKVVAIGRKNMDKMKTRGREKQPFVIQVLQDGKNHFYEARAVIDASGTWHNGNPIGSGGLYAVGEAEYADRIVYGIPDISGLQRDRYKNKSIAIVGGGHSAINTLLELDKLKDEYPDTQLHWILRKDKIEDVYGGKEEDALPGRGALGIRIEEMVNSERVSVYTPFQIQELKDNGGSLTLVGLQHGEKRALSGIDEIVANTGSRPELTFLRELRVDVDATVESVPALAALIDPNLHSCGTVRAHGELELQQKEKDFYIVGMKSYGRAPTFLMATGYEQVRSVVAGLMGDWEAARRVELDLPETGVCSSGAGTACCGTAPAQAGQKSACCS